MTVVTEHFRSLAELAAKAKGVELPMVVVPHPFETLRPEVLAALADEKVDEIVALIHEQLQNRSDVTEGRDHVGDGASRRR